MIETLLIKTTELILITLIFLESLIFFITVGKSTEDFDWPY